MLAVPHQHISPEVGSKTLGSLPDQQLTEPPTPVWPWGWNADLPFPHSILATSFQTSFYLITLCWTQADVNLYLGSISCCAAFEKWHSLSEPPAPHP